MTIDRFPQSRVKLPKDPRLSTSDQDFQKQFELLINLRDRLTTAHDAAREILRIQGEVKIVMERAAAIGATQDVATAAGILDERLESILGELIEMRSRFGNDVLSYPVKLNALFANLSSVVESSENARPRSLMKCLKRSPRSLTLRLTD